MRRVPKAICSIATCERPSHCRGWCKMHYTRWERHGDPQVCKPVPSPAADFYRSSLGRESDECIIWPFARNRDGYAIFVMDGSTQIVSRAVCKEVHGDPPSEEMQAAHLCGKGHLGCINQKHISWKTGIDNQADRLAHGTDSRGEKCGKAKLTNKSVAQIRTLASTFTSVIIAARFNVHPSTIDAVIRRKTWRHI